MEYQLQIGIRTNLISECNIDFVHNGMSFRFLLEEKEKPQKLHVIVDANDWQEAIRYFWRNLAQILDKFILYTGERVESIWYPEIILKGASGEQKRTLWYHDIISQTGHSFYQSQLNILKTLLETKIDDKDMYVISYLRLAIESYNIFDKYLNTFKAAESICSEYKETRKCPICRNEYKCQCRDGSNTSSYARPKAEHFEKIFNVFPYNDPKDSFLFFDWEKAIKVRHKCAHVPKREKININEIHDIARGLFLRVQNYLVNKYFITKGIDPISPGPLLGTGLSSGYHEYSFNTKYPNEKFAPDAPSLNEILTKVRGN